jgi:hypothetical protein
MTEVYQLTDEGNDLVDDAFMRGERQLTEEEIENARHQVDFDIDPEQLDVEGLREKFDAIRGDETIEFGEFVVNGNEYEPGSAEIDAKVASEVHRHLDLTREQASHDGLWRYLAVVEFPDFVRYRWPYPDPNRSVDSMRDKFLKNARDLYEHALVRLWWIAELTRNEEGYDLTGAALKNQELANDIFDRGYARYPPAVRATVDELRDANSNVVSLTTTKLNHALSTIRLESLNESDLRQIVREIRSDVESGAHA